MRYCERKQKNPETACSDLFRTGAVSGFSACRQSVLPAGGILQVCLRLRGLTVCGTESGSHLVCAFLLTQDRGFHIPEQSQCLSDSSFFLSPDQKAGPFQFMAVSDTNLVLSRRFQVLAHMQGFAVCDKAGSVHRRFFPFRNRHPGAAGAGFL